MAKPVVRIALDKDALLKLLPEGEFESHVVFDNSVINLLNETVNRLVCKDFIGRLEKKLNNSIEYAFSDGWHKEDAKKLVQKIIDETATRLITETYKKAVDDVSVRVNKLIDERLNHAERLVTQMTTPEAIENLMIKACAAIVKGRI